MNRMRKMSPILNKVAAILTVLLIMLSPIAIAVGSATDVAFAGREDPANLDPNGYRLNNNEEKNYVEKARDASNSSGHPYFIFDVEGIFNPDTPEAEDGPSGSKLWNGLVTIIGIITSAILLPIGIIFTTWRTAYIATLVYIGHIDPLHMVFDLSGQAKPRYQGDQSGGAWQRRSGGVNWGSLDDFTKLPDARQHQYARSVDETFRKYKHTSDWAATWNAVAKRALLVEVKNMGVGLFVVFAIWSLLNLMIWLATILLNFAGSTGGEVMTEGSMLQVFHLLL